MKAKDLLKQYDDAGRTKDAQVEALKAVYNEIPRLTILRNATTPSACLAIFKEVDQLWRAFVRRAGDPINPDAFTNVFKIKNPDTWQLLGVIEKTEDVIRTIRGRICGGH